ncbi:valyl-tRNA synthetase [Mucilaginibacter mallensis]|uniref:Valine--tRNA ligase n=1 Tax=Mucilaginibacter mallensis TaxID=652787 RepID=A0A1H1TRZ4_MUCMA|nr:valine--tRNA ligase [Mucilaginibacter mallensis]SDS62972.1 valyl-tRNA synthetase [Mucilaginibacter mallensis]
MSISNKTYQPKEAEDKWYSYWLQHKFFRSVPDEREPYTIVMPPPNVTGVLHMGHMLNNTIQDVLIRRARMQGKNACWVPGTDHASIATEAKVVAMLKERGIAKKDLTRAEFLSYAWEWKEKYGGIILDQLKKLGASCDWDRTRFTMDDDLSEAVIDTFIDLYKKGLIYRGVRMVNWDPQGKTAVSDEEVIRKEVNQKLYYIKYAVKSESPKDGKTESDLADLPSSGLSDFLTIATTRPETIMADAAICINPNDERYFHLHGKKAIIPLINREIPIILDEYVTMDFGTGCLKVTPAHDLNDYELGMKHHLPVIDILNDDGTLNEKAQILVGEDRFIARKKIATLLEDAGSLEKIEEYKSQVGFSERTDAVIEPKLSMQWFCKMGEMAKPALDYVLDGDIKLIPEKFENTYRHWMENVRDWNISRQLWWGQQIPAWYLPNGQYVIAKTAEEALVEAQKLTTDNSQLTTVDLTQDEDVLDTWFSSWLWPISVFDGFKDPNNADINYYYPTNDLVTAPEILFFWVARMIMAGHEFRGAVPFKNVYLTGIVRDKLGRKMSKSLGNSPDPIGLIEKFGADGVRVGMLLCSPAGNDLMFDESYCEQGRNFANKIWNAFKLIKGWEVDNSLPNPNQIAIEWFDSRFNQALVEIEADFAQYRLSEALMATYKLVWDDFCAWYLEMIKPVYQHPIDSETYQKTISFFENILKILHPFMPFITEELWHDELFGERIEQDCCIVAQLPNNGETNTQLLTETESVKQVIAQIRNIRNSKQISPKEILGLSLKSGSALNYKTYEPIIAKLANISELSIVDDKISGAISFMVHTDEFYIPLNESVDPVAERARLLKEKEYLDGFLKSVNAKLGNERFMNNAKPEIIEVELKKKNDAEAKLKLLEESLSSLAY